MQPQCRYQSHFKCGYGSNIDVLLLTRHPLPNLVHEVIMFRYVSSSQPDITRVTVTLTAPRVERTYSCGVRVEGRTGISDVGTYKFVLKGSGNSTASITGTCVQCMTAVLDCTAH